MRPLGARGDIPDHARLPLGEVLDAVAAETPAPGGGASAAWAAALAGALVEMAARFTLAREELKDRHERMREVCGRAAELRSHALALAERDLSAYGPVLEALKLPPDDSARAEQLDTALSDAAEPPLEIARAAAEIAVLAAELAATGNRSLEGDAVTAVVLAEAACAAAGRLVQIDLEARPQDPRLNELQRLVERARAARSSVPSA